MTKVKESAKVNEANSAKSAKRMTIEKAVQAGAELSAYQSNVLLTNLRLKAVNKSLGGCRAMLLNSANEIGLTPIQVKLLKASKEGENYRLLASLVRTSKAGNYSPFYLLQSLYKHEKQLKDAFKA